jgi:hypothetical protein
MDAAKIIEDAAENNKTINVSAMKSIVEKYRVIKVNHPRKFAFGIAAHFTLATTWAANKTYNEVVQSLSRTADKPDSKITYTDLTSSVSTSMVKNGFLGLMGFYITLPMQLVSRGVVNIIKRNNQGLWEKAVEDNR